LTAIDRLGFVPKAEARARARRHTGRIGVVTPFFTAPSFTQRLRGVAALLSQSNYELVIYTVDSASRLHGYISSIPLLGNLDGLVLMSLPIEDVDARRIVEHGLEAVLIEYPHPLLNSVEIDDEEGGRMAALHLLGKGHTRIGFIGDANPLEEFVIHPIGKRLAGFRAALAGAGHPMASNLIRFAPNTEEASRQAAQDLLGQDPRPTALFAAADVQALSVLKVARQRRLEVPDQLAVLGFDDIDTAEYADLTTISQHLFESGRLAAEILVSRLGNPDQPLQHVHLPLSLVERLST
ncbi:MAG TPA: substrate-binding domain-containing protein, partial [Anaerolineales bacterium]|nr:substrate-binding domain-containing protein [Anaerolineales bacterium]